jgi:hypothetical protein
MSEGITGTYEGEGANVSGALSVAIVPDVPTQNKQRTTSGQGIQAGATMDIRRRLRVSSECARSGLAISYGGGDQILTKCARGVYITTAGTLVLRMTDDSADLTFPGLAAGQYYPFAIALIRQTNSTAAGILLF